MFAILLSVLINANPTFDFLTLPQSPAAVSAVTTGIDALVVNPAGLVEEGSGGYIYENLWYTDSKATFIGFKFSQFGIKLSYFDFGRIEYQGETPNDEGGIFFSPYAFHILIMRGFKIDDELWTGIGLGVAHQKIYLYSASTVLTDAGAVYFPKRFPWLSAGFSIQNMGLKAGFKDEKYNLPATLTFSIGITLKKLTGTYSYRKILTYDTPWKELTGPGLEHQFTLKYIPLTNLEIMASYIIGREIDPWGVGISYTFKSFRLQYSYRPGLLGFDSPHIFGIEKYL